MSRSAQARRETIEPRHDVAQRGERLERDAPRDELLRERVLGEDHVGLERAAEVRDAPVADVHDADAGMLRAERADPAPLAEPGAARAARVRRARSDP